MATKSIDTNTNANINWKPDASSIDPSQLQMLQQLLSKPMSSYEKGAAKALEEAGAQHTIEAIQAGVPSSHIQSQLMNDKMTLLQNLLSPQGGNAQGQPVKQAQLTQQSDPQQTQQSQPVAQQQPTQPQQAGQPIPNQPQTPGYQVKQASSPFGFGGATMQDGTLVEQKPGFAGALLMSLLGRSPDASARADIGKIAGIQKVTGQEPLQPKDKLAREYKQSEQDYRNKEVELKQLQIDQIKAGNQPMNPEELFAQSNIPPEKQEDYTIKPVKQNIRGIIQTVPIVERKKTLPAADLKYVSEIDNNKKDMLSVVDRLKESGLSIGPGLSTTNSAIADMLAQMKGSEFSAIKADIGRNFQAYRKWATGVAAGYAELNMLAPNFPKATDSNDVFIKKSIDVVKDIDRNKNLMLDYFSKGGYAVSSLREMDGNGAQEEDMTGLSDEELRKIAGIK